MTDSLFDAVEKENVERVSYFINLRTDLDIRNAVGGTPLHQAIIMENEEILKLLLEGGACVNAQDMNENTPLHLAGQSGKIDLVKLLLNFGADISLKNDSGSNVLHAAIECTRVELDFLKPIVEAGTDVNEFSDFKETPFSLLVKTLTKPNIIYPDNLTKSMSIVKSMKFFIDYVNFNLTSKNGTNILKEILESDRLSCYREHFYKHILKYVAKFKALDCQIDSTLLETIDRDDVYKNYFTMCTNELNEAKKIRLDGCWVTFFNLIVDNKSKFVKYAGNADLVNGYKKRIDEVSIYRDSIMTNMTNGIRARKSWDLATVGLSLSLPIFNPTHLIIKDILDNLGEEYWMKLKPVNFE